MATHPDKIIIDGYKYGWADLPTKFGLIFANADSIISSKATTDSNRVVLLRAPLSTDTDIDKRKFQKLHVDVSWESAFMSRQLRDHLYNLYTTDQSFWIQYDSELSRDNTRLIPSTSNTYVIGEYQTYFTPTYPIAPYGYEPTDVRVYPGTIFVNGVAIYYDFTVDSETGVVRIKHSDLTGRTVAVNMAYTWKAYVRIIGMSIQPHADAVALEAYTGSVMLETVKPNYYSSTWNTLPDDLINTQVSQMQNSGAGYPRPTSQPTVSWGDTRYITGWT